MLSPRIPRSVPSSASWGPRALQVRSRRGHDLLAGLRDSLSLFGQATSERRRCLDKQRVRDRERQAGSINRIVLFVLELERPAVAFSGGSGAPFLALHPRTIQRTAKGALRTVPPLSSRRRAAPAASWLCSLFWDHVRARETTFAVARSALNLLVDQW